MTAGITTIANATDTATQVLLFRIGKYGWVLARNDAEI
jgi:hypothetical protein